MTEQPGAVVVGGQANGTGVVRALGRHGVVVDVVLTLRSDMARRSRYVRHHHWLLEIGERPESLIELLERHKEVWRGWTILPTNDHALAVLAKNHDRLAPRFRLTSPPWPITRKVVDKRITNQLAQEVGIAVPRTFGRATRSFTGAAELEYPVLVKPAQGHTFIQKFNKKLFVVHNQEELADAIEQVEKARIDCEIVEFVVGPDTCTRGFRVYIDASGEPRGELTIRKLRQEPPIFGVGRASEIVDAPELREPSLELLRRIGWRGFASVAFKTDARSGQLYFMEINGRSTLMDGIALRAGINYPLMAYSEATTGEIRGLQPNGWQGVWIHLHADFFTTIKNLGREEFSWREFLGSYLRPKTFADWAADDPGPFVAQWWFSLKKTPRRLRDGVQWCIGRVSSVLTQQPRHAARSERPGSVEAAPIRPPANPKRSFTQVHSNPSVLEPSHIRRPEDTEFTVQSEHADADRIVYESLVRRIQFAEACRYHLDVARNAIGLRRRLDTFQWFYYALTLAFDLTEWVRTRGRISHPGRAQHAALLAPIRLEQDARYRAYWYDPERHALVGVLLGLDLHRFENRYYLLEANLTAGLMTERRALYDAQIDPFISELINIARRLQFDRIVLYRRSWTHAHLEDFAAAASASGIQITPASAMKQKGDPLVNPMTALPEELVANTMYVVCTAVSDSPVFEFLHHKTSLCRRLNDIIPQAEVKPARLAAVPTYDEPRVSEEPLDPRWPNLVVKLANSDEGKDVLMGRFETEEQARHALGLGEERGALPRPFKSRIDRYWIDRLFPGALSAVYQGFVPPEVVDGFPKMIRVELFISPITDAFLSCHGTIGGEKLWDRAPSGILLQSSPYNVSVPPGRFVRLDQEIEEELKEVASEFGALARRALEQKFSVRPCREATPVDPTGHEAGD